MVGNVSDGRRRWRETEMASVKREHEESDVD